MRRVTKFLQRILFYLQPVEITKKIIKIILISRDVLLNRITHYPSTVASFENKFSDYIGVKYGLTFCNGTSSIEAALFALGVSKGDEVIVPSCTFHASIDPIVNIGARPIFADVGYGGVIVTADEVKTKITSKTKCVIVVHLFGYVVDMDEILKIIKEHDITLIEDVSHAHGAKCKNGMAGSYGDIGCFSLQGGKAIAAGEGGVAVTNNKNLMARMSMYGHFNRHNNIFSGDDKVYFDTGIGHKMRAHPLGITLANVDLIFNNYLNKKMK